MKNRFSIGTLLLLATLSASANTTITEIKQTVRQWRTEHGLTILSDFRDLLSLPNVATNEKDMQANANWIESYLTRRGFQTQQLRAGGGPYVFAERRFPNAHKTLLIYAHFDGQPVNVERWTGSPWQPILRTDLVENHGEKIDWPDSTEQIDPTWRIFARSAGDDKAPIIAVMAALDALTAAGLEPSVNIKLFLEGEEEHGSPTLAAVLNKHQKLLASDLLLFCDGSMHQSGRRQFVYGVRGVTQVHLTTYGAVRPLHSGHYGNWAPNPGELLVSLLDSFHDAQGRIAIKNFYQDVTPISKVENEAIAAMPDIDNTLKKELAIFESRLKNTRLEEAIMQPAAVITGIRMGTVGKDARNVILPSATATINFRLVPNQTPANVKDMVNTHIAAQGYTIIDHPPSDRERATLPNLVYADWAEQGYPALRTELDNREAKQLKNIITAMDGQPPLMTPTMGGSLPIYSIRQVTDAPIILLPISNHDNNQHGPDENLKIENLWRAIDTFAAVLAVYGAEEETLSQ